MNYIPYGRQLIGWCFLVAIAMLASLIASSVQIGGKHPLESAIIAILLGMLFRNALTIPQTLESGVRAFEKPLALGIVLLGASFNYYQFFEQGISLLLIVIGTMLSGLLAIILFSYLLNLPSKLSLLLALGTTICGGTAIAITAPLMKASEEETSYAIGVVAIWGIVALIAYPLIAQSLSIGDEVFGVFAGTAIHSTPQVVGAGFIFSEPAGKMATAVKLLRNCFIAPAAFGVAIWFARSVGVPSTENGVSKKISYTKILPWFLFGYFLMSFLYSEGFLLEGFSDIAVHSGKFLILVGMAGVGANTRLSAFRSLGLRPLFVGFFGSLVVAVMSALLIALLFHQST
jgi:uncharacterized integral membrane protein (TIGR00698 family)